MIDDRVLAMLLEAERHELEGRGDSPIARCVREDAETAVVARQLLSTLVETDDTIRDIAAARSGTIEARRTDTGAVRRRAARSGARPAFATLGLATAAIALFALVARDRAPSRAPRIEPDPLTARLDVSSDRPFAVFATDNPDIAIVWLFNEEEQ